MVSVGSSPLAPTPLKSTTNRRWKLVTFTQSLSLAAVAMFTGRNPSEICIPRLGSLRIGMLLFLSRFPGMAALTEGLQVSFIESQVWPLYSWDHMVNVLG